MPEVFVSWFFLCSIFFFKVPWFCLWFNALWLFFKVRNFFWVRLSYSPFGDVDSYSKAWIEFQQFLRALPNPLAWWISLQPCLKHQYIFQSLSLWTCPSWNPLHGMLGHTWDNHVAEVDEEPERAVVNGEPDPAPSRHFVVS